MSAPRRLAPVLSLALLATAAWAESGMPIEDIRIGVDGLMHPQVRERITLGDGRAQGFDWKQGDFYRTPGMRIEVTYVQGMSRRARASSGFVWGIGLNYTRWQLNPLGYSSNGVFKSGGRSENPDLTYQQFGSVLTAGYATLPRYTSVGDLHWEFMPTLRGGVASAETLAPDDNRSLVERDNAPWWEVGGKVGMVLQDEQWVLDLHIGVVYGESHPTIALPTMDVAGTQVSQGESELDLITFSPVVGLAFGWRF